MEGYFNNKKVFELITKWKFHLVIIVIISIVLAVVFSSPFFIKPKYKSSAILYPVNLPEFSEESYSEQMLQIIQSMYIRKNIFKVFNLSEHYKIDTTNKYYFTILNKEFESNVSFSKTKYDAVNIQVYDTDPEIASNMIDSIIKYYNYKVEILHKKKDWEIVNIKKREMEKKQADIDSLERNLKELRTKYGLLEYKLQSERLTEGYANLLVEGKGNTSASKEIKDMLSNLEDKGGEFLALNSLLWAARKTYNNIKLEYENALQEVEKNITYTQIVTHPFPADKKSYPVRWLIILFTAIASFLMTTIVIAIIESKEK